MSIQFITASNNEEVLQANLLRSPLFKAYPLTVQRGYTNISKAYNEAEITNSIVVYVHNDVYLPESFYSDLMREMEYLYFNKKAYWHVLGVAGVKLTNGKKESFGNILDRGREWKYNTNILPAEVQTLDEVLLITHGDKKFDENLDLDFYGADICMNRKCYAINAYCEHNSTRKIGERTESFYRCEKYFREKWKASLPIATTCSLLT